MDLLGNRGKGICGSGKWSGFPCGGFLVEVYELLIGVLIPSIVLNKCPV